MIDKINIKCRGGEGSDRLCQSHVKLSVVRSLEWQNLPLAQIPVAEAIVVLGGATKSAFFPRPTVDLSESGDAYGGLRLRVIYAAQLYRQKRAPIIILSGGRIDWRGGGSCRDRFANTFAKNRGSLAFAAKTSPCLTIKHFCQTPVQTHRTL